MALGKSSVEKGKILAKYACSERNASSKFEKKKPTLKYFNKESIFTFTETFMTFGQTKFHGHERQKAHSHDYYVWNVNKRRKSFFLSTR